MLDVVRFWLDRGVDGFRLDTINFYFHDKELRDNPPLAGAAQRHHRARGEPLQLAGSPLRQEPAGKPRVPAAVARADGRIPRTTAVGEVGDAQYGLQIQAEYTGRRQGAHVLCLRVPVGHRPTPERVREVMTRISMRPRRRLGLLGVFQP
jgi:alpha-glucosidase